MIEYREPAPGEAVPQDLGQEPSRHATPSDGTGEAIDETGAALFPQLVWAHYQWERKLHSDGGADPALEQAYRQKLTEFQRKEGRVEQVYWSTRDASAVAMTVQPGKPARLNGLGLRDEDDVVRLHRVTDWATRGAPRIADLLHECDLLAMRVSQVLLGTTEQIALRWILGIEMHLLGFLEREGTPDEKAEAELVGVQRRKLAECEAYYHRAASKSGRIVYVSGMLIGVWLAALFGLVVGFLLWAAGLGDDRLTILICYGAGAIGALVSALSRMSRAEHGRFNIDFELGARFCGGWAPTGRSWEAPSAWRCSSSSPAAFSTSRSTTRRSRTTTASSLSSPASASASPPWSWVPLSRGSRRANRERLRAEAPMIRDGR